MAQVTSGVVRFEDAIKKPGEGDPQYWLSKKAAVELSFSVDAGEDYQTIFDTVTNAATNRVNALLGARPAVVETAAPEAEAVPAKRRRRTAAEIAAAGASPTGSGGGAQTLGDDPTGGEENVIHLPDEGASGDDSFDIEPAAETLADALAAGADSFDIEPAAESAEKITDADLNSEVQKKNAEIADPNAIRALISSYNPDPKAGFQLRQIDPAKRAEFLDKLHAMKKADKSA